MTICYYFGIGAGVAAFRLLLERIGQYHYTNTDSTWYVASAMTDVFMWPLVVVVALLNAFTKQQVED